MWTELIAFLPRLIVEAGSALAQMGLAIAMTRQMMHIPLGTEVTVMYQGSEIVARGMKVERGWIVTINRKSVFIPNSKVISGTTEDPTP